MEQVGAASVEEMHNSLYESLAYFESEHSDFFSSIERDGA